MKSILKKSYADLDMPPDRVFRLLEAEYRAAPEHVKSEIFLSVLVQYVALRGVAAGQNLHLAELQRAQN